MRKKIPRRKPSRRVRSNSARQRSYPMFEGVVLKGGASPPSGGATPSPESSTHFPSDSLALIRKMEQ